VTATKPPPRQSPVYSSTNAARNPAKRRGNPDATHFPGRRLTQVASAASLNSVVPKSEPGRKDQRAESVFMPLGFELACAQDIRVAETEGGPIKNDAKLPIPDPVLFIHTAAVAESVAIEENVAGHVSPLETAPGLTVRRRRERHPEIPRLSW
jgi:hypothetical protein